MYSAAQVTAMIDGWKRRGDPLPQLVVEIAEACIGWPYVWGSGGQEDTVSRRQAYMNGSHIGQGDKELIKKRCQVLNGSAGSCDGCKYYPGGARVRMFDCRGFTAWVLAQVGISITGGGATSQWNTAANWEAKGTIDTLPTDRVCCIFRWDNATQCMEHTLLYDGAGNYIHCSGEVKKQAVSSYKATHWAIPKKLYADQPAPAPAPAPAKRPTLRKGSRGEDVRELQQLLIAKGYSCGSCGADGIFGNDTQYAVRKFQLNNALEMDGIVGSATWSALLQPEEPKKETGLWRVVIRHLDLTQASALCNAYPNASKEEEVTGDA